MAADNENPRHKPGLFKQQNKSHKTGRHRSKGQLLREVKGKTNAKTVSKKIKASLKKQERKNQQAQLRRQHREEVLSIKRSHGSLTSPPFNVAVIALSKHVDTKAALDIIASSDDQAKTTMNDLGVFHLFSPKFKQRFAFTCPRYSDLYAMLDCVKTADSILFLISADSGIDEAGDYTLSCLMGQGLPSTIFAVQGLESISIKKRTDVKKMLQKSFEKRIPDKKLFTLDSPSDGSLILRTTGSQKLHPVPFCENRPHLLIEKLSFELDNDTQKTGVLQLSGFLRGKSLDVNGLVYLPGWDAFQIKCIEAPQDPYTQSGASHRSKGDIVMETESGETRLLETSDPLKQESLQSEVVPDPMEGEQTWPTEEELEEAELLQKKKITKKVPKGTSEYQAAWIVDSDVDDDDSDEDSDEDNFDEDVESVDMSMHSEDEETGERKKTRKVSFASTVEEKDDSEMLDISEGNVARYDDTLDLQAEEEMLVKLKESRMDQMFPDEVDTPRDQSARTRFQRYRGLKSFRTSPWDPKEDLPHEYAKIFQFANFKRTKKRVLMEESESKAVPGMYITVHLKDVPMEYMEGYQPGMPLVAFGLLSHEQKMSVVHFLIKRWPGSRIPIKSKERMTFHVGFRRFSACPIYSQHTNGNKHKFERFLQDITVATVFAPIVIPPSPVLMFRDKGFGKEELIGIGSLMSVDPNRIVTKRVTISGHPFKINKKHVVVRYMFFNPDDILWFKPVELHTKWGCRGYIKEALGTHGHMKCTLDRQLKSQDTVLMSLYKRIYPKWTYSPRVAHPKVSSPSQDVVMDSNVISQFFD